MILKLTKYFLFQMLENIFDRVDQRNDLLSLRLVNKSWNAAANEALERRTLNVWKEMEPFPNGVMKWTNTHTFPVFKYLPSNRPEEAETLGEMWNRIRRDRRWLNMFKNQDVNPFPNNSLLIPVLHPKNPKFKPNLYKCLEGFGHYLTSLEIGQLKSLTTTDLYNVLKLVPNLKALNIHMRVHIDAKKMDLENMDLKNIHFNMDFMTMAIDEGPPPPSPNPGLTHLRINNKYPISEPPIVKMLLQLFAPQLVSLQLMEVDFSPFDQSFWNNGTGFKNLKVLEITNKRLNLGQGDAASFTFPLQHLSTAGITMNLLDLLSFLDKFSDTLRTFYFYVNSVKEVDVEEQSGAHKFKNIEKLVVADVFGADDGDLMAVLRKHFAPRFQNLKSLELHDCDLDDCWRHPDWPDKAKAFFEREKFWDLFPKLENFEMADSYTEFRYRARRVPARIILN